jgi:O-6-methylguanine DNA methyltransferase
MRSPLKSLLIEISIPTADGNFTARYSERGLASLNFPTAPATRVVSSKSKAPLAIRGWHRTTVAALKSVMTGKAAKLLPPLDWSGKTEFQQAVWSELLNISLGKTCSYGDIAERIGRPKAYRAVGGACRANPIPVLVPCHRVLAADHKLGGFSGGLDRKISLLAREGVTV